MKLRSAADALPRRVLLTLCLGGFVESTSGWQSVFLNATNESWTRQTVALGGRDFRLDDYSYTGYALSEFEAGQDIPPTVYPISASSGDDITTVLQTTVSNAASGGHITIPAGTFVITSTVFVTTGNLSIEGPGSGMTTVRISSAYRPADLLNESPICFRGGSQTDISLWLRTNQAVALCAITSDIARGAFTVEVDSTNGFGAGDWVVLQQYFPQAFSLSNSGGAWPTQPTNTADYNLTFTYLRRTVSVSNSLITLDAPLPRGLRTTDQPIRMFKPAASNYLENVGIEALTILVETNTNSTGDFTGRPAGIGLSFINTFNGWARDVKILNVAKAGFQPTWSARISLQDCLVERAQDMGDGGYGYGFHNFASQNTLYRRCEGRYLRHNFTCQKTISSMVIFTRCRSLKIPNVTHSLPDDTHTAYSHAILWDAHSQTGAVGLEAVHRATSSVQACETFGGGAVWNFWGDGNTSNPQAGKVQLSPALCGNGDALVIGVWGGHKVYDGSQTTNGYTTGTRMTHTMAEVGPRGNVAYEGIDATGLVPYSLYEAQLLSRGRRIPGDRIIIAATVTDTFAVLSWTGATGWNYTVRSSTNLMRATEWNNTRFDREPGRDGTMVFTNTNQESPIYFRVLGGLL